jgi:hypothetical protein
MVHFITSENSFCGVCLVFNIPEKIRYYTLLLFIKEHGAQKAVDSAVKTRLTPKQKCSAASPGEPERCARSGLNSGRRRPARA